MWTTRSHRKRSEVRPPNHVLRDVLSYNRDSGYENSNIRVDMNPVFPTDNDDSLFFVGGTTIPPYLLYQCCKEAIYALLLPVEGIWNMVEVLKPNKRTTSVWSVKIAFIAVCVLLVASSYSSLQSFDYEAALRSGLVQWQSNISAAIFTSNEDNLLQEFQTINDRLLGPDEYGTGGCPPGCGCPIRPFADCPRHYTIQDVQISSSLGTSTAIRQTSREKVRIIQQQAQALCQQATDVNVGEVFGQSEALLFVLTKHDRPLLD